MADETPQTTLSPSDAAVAVSKSLMEQEQQARQAYAYDQIDGIKDPGRPAPARITEQREQGPTQETVRGATADGGLTPELLARAQANGILPDEAKSYKPEHLTKLLDRYEESAYDEGEAWAQQQQPQQQFAPPPNTIQGPDGKWYPAPWAQQQQQLPRLDPEKYEPDLVAAFEYQQQVIAQQQQHLAQMGQQFQQFNQRAQEQQITQQRQTLERIFNADADYADVLGKGTTSEVQNTAAGKARFRVGMRMDAIENEYRSQGMIPPPVETIYQQARDSLFGPRAQEREARQTIERMRAANGQFIAKPTATTRSEPTRSGDETAVEHLRRYMADPAAFIRESGKDF